MAGDSFCDSSIPAEKAAGFYKWAKQQVQYPAKGELQDFFKLRCTEDLGTHMVAQRSFDCDDVIISEESVLRIPRLSPEMKQKIRTQYGRRGQFLSPAIAIDWNRVEEISRQAVMNLFWAHPGHNKKNCPLLDETRRACQHLLNEHDLLQERFGVGSLVRFLHIVDLNIHRDNENPVNADFAGLFILGSKFTHSCEPNTQWVFTPDGCLQYQAIRPIKPGDIFTFSYIGKGMSLLEGTVARRRQLACLWFVCQCSRCLAPDLARQMRCPSCSSEAGCLPQMLTPDASKIDWAAEDPLDLTIPDEETWQCTACGNNIPRSEKRRACERECEQLLPQVFEGDREDAREAADRALQLRSRVAHELGPAHWIGMLATFAWLQKCHMQLQSYSILDFTELDLQTASRAIAQWMKKCVPYNTHQRLSAFSLSLRLASHVGGTLESWGYDPDDPLQDGGLLTAKRLMAQHGVCDPGSGGKPSLAWDYRGHRCAAHGQVSPVAGLYRARWQME